MDYRRPGDTVVDEMKITTTKPTYDATKTGRRLIQHTTKRRLDGDEHNLRRNDSDDYAKLRRNEEHDDAKRVTRRREEQFSTGLRSSDDTKCHDRFCPQSDAIELHGGPCHRDKPHRRK